MENTDVVIQFLKPKNMFDFNLSDDPDESVRFIWFKTGSVNVSHYQIIWAGAREIEPISSSDSCEVQVINQIDKLLAPVTHHRCPRISQD